jgi:hypothetical protein
MSTREINVNDVWRRREPLGDTFDEIVVRGCVDHASFRPSVWVITSATDFYTLQPINCGDVFALDFDQITAAYSTLGA